MATVRDYVKNYGNIPFSEKPFCDEDNVALCMSFYMPLDKAVSPSFDDEPVPFKEACDKLFALRGNKHKPVGLVLVKGISQLLMEMSEQPRYADMKVVACTDNFNVKPAVQFNAATYLLPTGEILVLFRGTDDTLTGWKEDFDLLAFDGDVPSNQLAMDYLKEVAARFEGDIIVAGHSKGGYVSQYAVLNAPKEIRDRIVAYYNNDGPGLPTYDYLDEGVYEEMRDRYHHLIPGSSFIGMMLAHDEDVKIIKSNKITGAMQHDMLTWQFNGEHLMTKDDITRKSKVSDLLFYDIRNNFPKEQILATERALSAVFEGMGTRGLLDVKAHPFAALKGGKKAYKDLDKETKDEIKAMTKAARKSLKTAIKEVRTGGYRTVSVRLGKY